MNELIEGVQYQIAAYQPFAAQLKELQAKNASLVFDYSDESGNRAARSYIYKLRRTKTAVDSARKAEKDESLQRGRLIDTEAKSIIGQIEEMIEVHQKPLDEIEEKEAQRVGALRAVVDDLIETAAIDRSAFTSEAISNRLIQVESLVINSGFREFMATATEYKEKAVAALKAALCAAQKREADAAELIRLREETAARERKDREELIARNAAEKATEDAKKRDLEMQEAAAKREQELTEQAERAKRQAVEAQERADQAIKATEERIKRETEAKASAEAAEQAKRESDKKHKARINNEAKHAIISGGFDDAVATVLVTMIAQGKIPHVTIRY